MKKRIQETLSCKDADSIPKVNDAGEIHGKGEQAYQIMHNGLKIYAGSYHDFITEIITKSKGHHEPQEECVFHELLKHIPEGATMIELGSYWAYYSMWFNKEVKNAKNYMIEPIKDKLNVGKKHFTLNKLKGTFTQAAIGRTSKKITFDDGLQQPFKVDQVCIDDFIKKKKITRVAIVHADIQGYELEMLHGAEQTFDNIDSFVISTHGEIIHQQCLRFLKNHGHNIVADHTPAESYSGDGLIVSCSANLPVPPVHITRKHTFTGFVKKLYAKLTS